MRCFVISPIGEEGSEVRAQADIVFEHIVTEALVPLDFQVERADNISESGLITTQIIERIVSCDLLVADLTGHNANVFYELAIRHLAGRSFIHLIEAGQKIPFDVSASRTIQYTLDLPGAKRAVAELQRQAKAATAEGAKVESPISIAIDLKALGGSEDPTATAIRRIEAELAEIKLAVQQFTRVRASDILSGMKWADDEVLPPASGSWTDEKVEKLKEMWNDGRSASQIGKVLGVSRNAVIGKVHRLGIRTGPVGPSG